MPKPKKIVDAPRADAKGLPLVTVTILLALVILYACEQAYGLGDGRTFGPNYRSLVALGGVDGALVVGRGEWWRLLTASMLHGSVAHLIGNGIVLALVGWRLERLIGAGWFSAIYLVSGIGGAVASTIANDPNVVGVGASGAIMGLLAAILVGSFHGAAKGQRVAVRILALRVMIPALLPLGGSHGIVIDYSAHLGGALTGGVMGLLMSGLWPEADARPVLAPVAGLVGLAGAVMSAVALLLVSVHYPAYEALSERLIPDSMIPKNWTELTPDAAGLSAQYPLDPTGHLLRAVELEKSGSYPDAEQELRTALSETDQFIELPGQEKTVIQFFLAMVLLQEGRRDEAKAAAAVVCSAPFANAKMKSALAEQSLCLAPMA